MLNVDEFFFINNLGNFLTFLYNCGKRWLPSNKTKPLDLKYLYRQPLYQGENSINQEGVLLCCEELH